MRKSLAAFVLLSVSSSAYSALCCVNGTQCRQLSGNDTFNATASVRATDSGNTIRIDGYRLACGYYPYDPARPPSVADYWRTYSPVLTPSPKFSAYRTGLSINGTVRLNPIASGLLVATLPNNGSTNDLSTFMVVEKRGLPGSPIQIRTGDNLGSVRLRQTNNVDSTSNIITVNLKAGNDLIVEPSSCTINGNRAIEVDFGDVNPNQLGSDPMASIIRKTERLNYTCPDPGITTPITITFNGLPASFDRRVLATGNNLGTGMVRLGTLVAPNDSFLTNITNSSGGDDVTFSLVRNPAAAPSTGAFTASGTLIMGVP